MSKMAIAYNMKKKARGGAISPSPSDSCGPSNSDIVDRIMMKKMSKGGRVANSDPFDPDESPNEFDDLALRDDLEFSYDGENSGDYEGNEQHEEDERDIISRIMKSRRLKDRNPRPA